MGVAPAGFEHGPDARRHLHVRTLEQPRHLARDQRAPADRAGDARAAAGRASSRSRAAAAAALRWGVVAFYALATLAAWFAAETGEARDGRAAAHAPAGRLRTASNFHEWMAEKVWIFAGGRRRSCLLLANIPRRWARQTFTTLVADLQRHHRRLGHGHRAQRRRRGLRARTRHRRDARPRDPHRADDGAHAQPSRPRARTVAAVNGAAATPPSSDGHAPCSRESRLRLIPKRDQRRDASRQLREADQTAPDHALRRVSRGRRAQGRLRRLDHRRHDQGRQEGAARRRPGQAGRQRARAVHRGQEAAADAQGRRSRCPPPRSR